MSYPEVKPGLDLGSPLSAPEDSVAYPVSGEDLLGDFSDEVVRQSDQPATIQDELSIRIASKDIQAMGIAAGGKLSKSLSNAMIAASTKKCPLVQDIYSDPHPARIWNVHAAQIVNVHILDPASCERVTHIVPKPPPMDAQRYAEDNLPFFVVEEQVNHRLEGGDFDAVRSVSAMDQAQGVTTEPSLDPSKPVACGLCKTRLCDCVYVRPRRPSFDMAYR
jgi:hypothetical protein